ncbi:cytochrome b-c1 complex subunit 8 [Xylariales sp. AK1849]|nr:cytochrome b-c1 complex subunit 8 [Xylariales sp. AK1849]
MQLTRVLQEERPVNKYGKYLNKDTWGNLGCALPQKGIITYGRSPNRQNIMKGFVNPKNGWRRFRHQVLYWAPPMIAAYYLLIWAEERNRFLNSKDGRALLES